MTESPRAEIVAECYAAFNREGAPAVLRYVTHDTVWYSAPGWAGKPVFRGQAGVLELIAEWTENFVDYQWEPAVPEELSDGRVLLLNRHKGRTRDGVSVDAPLGSVWELEGDLIATVRFFFTWEEALEAAGVEVPGIGSSAG